MIGDFREHPLPYDPASAWRRAFVTGHRDGDTIEVRIDVGFNMTMTSWLRLAKYNAPELKTPEGPASKAALEAYLPLGAPCMVLTYKNPNHRDKYGRWLAEVMFYHDGILVPKWDNLGAVMLARGLVR